MYTQLVEFLCNCRCAPLKRSKVKTNGRPINAEEQQQLRMRIGDVPRVWKMGLRPKLQAQHSEPQFRAVTNKDIQNSSVFAS